MVGEQIRTMLEKQMETSKEFTATNFGLAIGDDFPEMVKEVIKSEKVTATLLCDLLIVGLTSPTIGKSLQPSPLNPESYPPLEGVILKHLETFKPSLQFLYWGIQIGRQLERQQAETLKGLEQN